MKRTSLYVVVSFDFRSDINMINVKVDLPSQLQNYTNPADQILITSG